MPEIVEIPGFHLEHPIQYRARRSVETGDWIVSDFISVCYGWADTEAKAVADYVASLVEYYDMAERDVRRAESELRQSEAVIAQFRRMRAHLYREPLITDG